MKTLLESNIWKFYLIKALGIRFIAPIRILYLLYFGLSYSQIGMMELAAAVVIVLLEIPTGVFADIVGRKSSRMIAYLLSIIAFSCLSFGSGAAIFIFGWALSGAADAFESGASDAIIFDTLKELGRENEYLKLKSRFLAISTAATVIGSLTGALLYKVDHRLPWYLITLTIVISALIFATVKEPKSLLKKNDFTYQWNEYKKSFWLSLANIDVLKLIGVGIILAIPMYVFVTLVNQPYLLSRGFGIESLGVVFAFITVISGAVAAFSSLLEKKLKKRLSFLFIFIAMASVLVALGMTKNMAALALVVIFYIVDNYKNIILDNYINLEIDSGSRATILSIQSFVNNISISVLFVFIGYLVDLYSIDKVLIYMGVAVGIATIPFWTISNRVKEVKTN